VTRTHVVQSERLGVLAPQVSSTLPTDRLSTVQILCQGCGLRRATPQPAPLGFVNVAGLPAYGRVHPQIGLHRRGFMCPGRRHTAVSR
jgi:hypothetical protein